MIKKLLATAVVTFGIAGAAQAATYDIDWTGAGGYTMEGTLTFDDSLLGTGVIGLGDISELAIEIFQGAVSLGSRSLSADGLGSFAGSFNLNFDTVAEQFVVGGFSGGPTGQDWFTSTGGSSCDTVGFSSGSGAQAVCVGGSIVGASFIPISSPTLNATRVDVVPLPAGMVLLLSALGIGGLAARRKAA